MSSSHGSTSGHPAHPSPPSGSGHSSLSQQQQHQQQSSSDDGLSRRLPERRRADVAPKTQAGHPPISSPPKQPPSSASASSSLSTSSSAPQPSSSSKSAVISSFAAAVAPKAQQPCAQLAKDKSACRDYKVEDIAGAPASTAKPVHVAQDRKAFPRVDPAERLLMTGEEMAGTRPKRPRGSSQTHMEVDITPSEHHTRVQRINGAHRDTMRSETHVHTQEMLTDEEESDEPRKGETIAEIHFYREDTPPSIASLGLPSSEDQTPTGDYTSVSATVIRKHSMKGPALTPDQPPPEQRIGESPSADSTNAQQPSGQKLLAIQDKADLEKMVEQTDSVMQPVEDSEEAKSATLSPNSNRTTASVLQQSDAAQADVKPPHADHSQSKVLKEEEKSKTASSKSWKEQEKTSPQNDSLDACKRIPGILPPEEEWESTYDPNQPLEERLTATVIRRHIKSKTTTPASSTTKKQQPDPKQESSVPTDTSSDTAHAETPGDVRSPTKDKSFSPIQDKLPAKNGPSEELPKPLIGDSTTKTVHQSSVLQQNGDTLRGVLKLDSKTAKEPSQRIIKTELITSSVCDSSKDLNSSVKKSVQTSVGVKDVVVSVQSDASESAKERNSMKKESALQGSTLLSKKEMPVVQYNAGSKSPSPGKRVSIREPPETVVLEDSDVSAQRSSKSGASKTSPSSKDVESAEGHQPATGDSEVESGSWVEEGRDAATKAEVNGLANPRNSKSCCFCWCCCCSCSCLSVNNNIRRSNASKQQQPTPGGNIDHYFNGEGEPQPTLEDIRTWGESFDKLMKCGAGRKVFREFLQCEYSEENILFWLACEDLKKETNPQVVEEKARVIYEDFISILSPREVSLDSRVRDIINKNMVRPTPNTFDEAQLQIYTLMHRDSYPRFVNSPIYRKLAQLPVPSRKGSMA